MSAASVDTAEWQGRRDQLQDVMGDHAIAILLPAPQRQRSADVNWPYRQHNHLVYLTNTTGLGTRLMLINNGRKRDAILFAKLSDPGYEVWEGKLPGVDTLRSQSGIEKVYGEKQFDATLRRLLNGLSIDPNGTGYTFPEHPELFEALISDEVEVWLDLGRYRRIKTNAPVTAEQKLAATLQARFPELKIRNLSPALEAMRRIKSDYELALMQRAIDITGEAHRAAMLRARGATHEYQIQATIEYTFRNAGACCRSFPSITAGGSNATILHYSENDAALQRDSLLLMDIGAEVEYYAADITRTIPVSGEFSDDQRLLYDAVLQANRAALKAARPGETMASLTEVSNRALGAGLLRMGLITEDIDEQVKSYSLHSLGHSVGMDVHDAFEYHLPLEPGMVITIEPGLYVRPQDIVTTRWYADLNEQQKLNLDAALNRFDGMGVRIEDEILITRRGARNLSADIPVSVEAIEAIMATYP
ncbi:MAG: aminopeptidase P family protein [Pseudomonadota bacterium]